MAAVILNAYPIVWTNATATPSQSVSNKTVASLTARECEVLLAIAINKWHQNVWTELFRHAAPGLPATSAAKVLANRALQSIVMDDLVTPVYMALSQDVLLVRLAELLGNANVPRSGRDTVEKITIEWCNRMLYSYIRTLDDKWVVHKQRSAFNVQTEAWKETMAFINFMKMHSNDVDYDIGSGTAVLSPELRRFWLYFIVHADTVNAFRNTFAFYLVDATINSSDPTLDQDSIADNFETYVALDITQAWLAATAGKQLSSAVLDAFNINSAQTPTSEYAKLIQQFQAGVAPNIALVQTIIANGVWPISFQPKLPQGDAPMFDPLSQIALDKSVSHSVFVSMERHMRHDRTGVVTTQSFDVLIAIDPEKLRDPVIAAGRSLIEDVDNVHREWALLLYYEQYAAQMVSASSPWPLAEVAIAVTDLDWRFMTPIDQRRAAVRVQAAITIPVRECYSRTLYPVLVHRGSPRAIDPTPLVALDLRVEKRCVRCYANVDTSSTRAVAVPCQWLWNPQTQLPLAMSLDKSANMYRSDAVTLLRQLDHLLSRRFHLIEASKQWYQNRALLSPAELVRAYNAQMDSMRTTLAATFRFSSDYLQGLTQPLTPATPNIQAVVESTLNAVAVAGLSVLPVATKMPYERALMVAHVVFNNNNNNINTAFDGSSSNAELDAFERELFQRTATVLLTQWRYFNDLLQSDITRLQHSSINASSDQYVASERRDALIRYKQQIEKQPLMDVTTIIQQYPLVVHSSDRRAVSRDTLSAIVDLNSLYVVQQRQKASSALSSQQFYSGSHASYTGAPSLSLIQITSDTVRDKKVPVTTDAFAPVVPYFMDTVELSDVQEDYFDNTSPTYRLKQFTDHHVTERGGFTNAQNWTQAPSQSALEPQIYGSGRRFHYQLELALRTGARHTFDVLVMLSNDAPVKMGQVASVVSQMYDIFEMLEYNSGGSPIALLKRLVQLIQQCNDIMIQQLQQPSHQLLLL
jgi:hypothetical protein